MKKLKLISIATLSLFVIAFTSCEVEETQGDLIVAVANTIDGADVVEWGAVTVEISTEEGTLIASVTPDAYGEAEFKALLPGTYYIDVFGTVVDEYQTVWDIDGTSSTQIVAGYETTISVSYDAFEVAE